MLTDGRNVKFQFLKEQFFKHFFSSSSRVHSGCFGGCRTALGWGVSTSSTASVEQVVAADLDPVEHSEPTAPSGLEQTVSVVSDGSPGRMN